MKISDVQDIQNFDPATDELVVRRKTYRISGPFTAIGRVSTVEEKSKVDIFSHLVHVSKSAFVLFNELKERRNPDTNIAEYSTAKWSSGKTRAFQKSLRQLRDHNIVRIVKADNAVLVNNGPMIMKFPRGSYIINPKLLKCWQEDVAQQIWEQGR